MSPKRFLKKLALTAAALGLGFVALATTFSAGARHAPYPDGVPADRERSVRGTHDDVRVAAFAVLQDEDDSTARTRAVTDHLAPAIDEIARQLAGLHAKQRRGRGVQVAETTRSEWAAYAARRLRTELERRGVPVVEERKSASRVMKVSVDERHEEGAGPVIAVACPGSSYTRRIVCAAVGSEAEAVVLGPNDFFVHLKTSVQLTREDSAEDAKDALARRVESDLFRRMRAEGRIRDADEARFRADLRRRYGRDLLLSQGDMRLLTVERPTGDLTHYETYASWRSGEDTVGLIARTVADALRLERMLPFIRAGLALGALILAVIGWLKIDWWLKGHHSFLTKLLCATLWLIGVGVIWRFPIHG